MEKEQLKTVTIRMPVSMELKIRDKALDDGRTFSNMVVRIIEGWLKARM